MKKIAASLSDIIANVQASKEARFIPCTDVKNQASIRVQLFNLRKKIYGDNSLITFCNYTYGNQLFVKVYIKADIIAYKLGKNGELILAE